VLGRAAAWGIGICRNAGRVHAQVRLCADMHARAHPNSPVELVVVAGEQAG